MQISLRIDTTEGEREMELTAGLFDGPIIDRALQQYGESWLKQRVQAHIDGARPPKPRPGAEQRGAGKLRKKLQRDVKRAEKRLGKVRDYIGFRRESNRQKFLAAQGKRSRTMPEVIRARVQAVERREQVLAELDRIANGTGGESLLKTKAAEKLKQRLERSVERERNKKPLGRIASSFTLKVKDGKLVYGSEIPWSGVHNEGGTVGHGAVIQPNPFAYLEPVDIEVLVAALMGEGIEVALH